MSHSSQSAQRRADPAFIFGPLLVMSAVSLGVGLALPTLYWWKAAAGLRFVLIGAVIIAFETITIWMARKLSAVRQDA